MLFFFVLQLFPPLSSIHFETSAQRFFAFSHFHRRIHAEPFENQLPHTTEISIYDCHSDLVLSSSQAAEVMSTELGLGTFLRVSSIAIASYESVAPSRYQFTLLMPFPAS